MGPRDGSLCVKEPDLWQALLQVEGVLVCCWLALAGLFCRLLGQTSAAAIGAENGPPYSVCPCICACTAAVGHCYGCAPVGCYRHPAAHVQLF